MTEEVKSEDFYEILDTLRESGAINMFGAPKWLEDNYGLSREDARRVFKDWADQFGK